MKKCSRQCGQLRMGRRSDLQARLEDVVYQLGCDCFLVAIALL